MSSLQKIVVLFAVMFICLRSTGQDSLIVCDEKYLPFEMSLGFLYDSVHYRHEQTGINSYVCFARNSDEWFAKYTKKYVNGVLYFDTEFNNKHGKLTCDAYFDTANIELSYILKDYDANYMIRNRRLNYITYGYHNNSDYLRLEINADQRGFKDNARVGQFIYTYDNGKPFAKGSYSGDYLKIDTSDNGNELIFYNNLGNELKRIKNTVAAVDSLKKLYSIYKFDFSFPILVEFRDGWWEFGNYDGTPDRKILYSKGKEVETEKR